MVSVLNAPQVLNNVDRVTKVKNSGNTISGQLAT
jgi:hypothetical protein